MCVCVAWRLLQPCSMKPWVAISMWSDSPPMCIYIYIYMSVYLPVKVNERMSLKQSTFMTWKIAHPWWGSNPRSLDYIPSSIDSRHVSDHQSNAYQIYFYISGAPNQEIVYENDKNMNCRCPMTAILNFTICGETVPFTAWHTAEMDSAQKFI